MLRRNAVSGLRKYYRAVCTVSEQVGDLVYISGPMTGDKLTVRKCDPSDQNKMPAWGMIVRKDSDTDCVVQKYGFVAGVYSGLIPGAVYWVDSAGELGDYPRPGFAQIAGQAVDPDVFFLEIETNMTRLI